MVLWKEFPSSSQETWVPAPTLSLTAVSGVRPFLALSIPSIIRKFIFSFNNLWWLFPFSDGVTNYFIIGFLKTSYLLFGSISRTPMWLSFILIVGLPGEKSNGGTFQDLKQILYLLFQGSIYIGAELILHLSKFLLGKCSLPILLFHSADAQALSAFPLLFRDWEENQQWSRLAGSETLIFPSSREPPNIRHKVSHKDHSIQPS